MLRERSMSDVTDEVQESRTLPRFVFRRPVEGTFNLVPVRILNVSSTGMQIEHADTLKLRTPSRVIVDLPRSVDTVTLRGQIIWSWLSQTPNPDGRYVYRSGVRLEEQGPAVGAAVDRLITVYSGEEDPQSLERKRAALRAKAEAKKRPLFRPLPLTERQIDQDQKMLVEQTFDRLLGQPDQIESLSQKARLSLFQRSEGHTLSNQVLAVWEYLDRTVPVDVITRILSERRR